MLFVNGSKLFFLVLSDWLAEQQLLFVKVKERIVLREIHLRTTGCHLQMGSHSVICHPTEVTRLHPNPAGWYSIYRPRKDERLSWLVTYRNGLPVYRRSPILVLTRSDVAQLR